MKIGFDNDLYLKTQSEHIKERIEKFGGKLYLEFGGKLFDDYHASRVLPGFHPDSKISMLMQLKDQAEAIVCINSNDIEKNKISILHKLQPFRIKRFFFCIRIGTGIKSCVNSCCLCLTEKFCQEINLEKRFSSAHSDSTFVTPVILITKSLFQKLRRGVLLPLSHFPGVRIMAELAAHCTSTQEYHISDARSVY